jgi:inorganic pyrophosphatase
LGDDGDPLDILILMDAATCTGCVVSARALGVIEAEQTQDGSTFRNDLIIAIAVAEHERASLHSLDEIAAGVAR